MTPQRPERAVLQTPALSAFLRMKASPTGGHLGTGPLCLLPGSPPLGRLNCAPSLNDSALERRAPCARDRVPPSTRVPCASPGRTSEGRGQEEAHKREAGPGSFPHSPLEPDPFAQELGSSSSLHPSPLAPSRARGRTGQAAAEAGAGPSPAEGPLEMAHGLLSVCASCLQPHPAVGRELWPLSPRAPASWPSPESSKALHDHLSLWPAGQSCVTCLKTGERNLVFALSK